MATVTDHLEDIVRHQARVLVSPYASIMNRIVALAPFPTTIYVNPMWLVAEKVSPEKLVHHMLYELAYRKDPLSAVTEFMISLGMAISTAGILWWMILGPILSGITNYSYPSFSYGVFVGFSIVMIGVGVEGFFMESIKKRAKIYINQLTSGKFDGEVS